MQEVPTKLRTPVLLGGWAVYVGYRALLSRFPDTSDVTTTVLIALEAVIFAVTVVLSLWSPRRLWQGWAFIATVALTSLSTHFLLFIWVWYAIEAGPDGWPAVVLLVVAAAAATAVATGAFLARPLLTHRFVTGATIGRLIAVVPLAVAINYPAFPGDNWIPQLTKPLWLSSFFALLWASRRQIQAIR